MIIKIFTGPLNYNIEDLYNKDEKEYIIGVDQGAILLAEQGISIDLAVGDFDSVTSDEYEMIVSKSKEVHKYEAKKDYTDTYLAVIEALEIEHEEIIIYGGIGRRFDHSYANLNLLRLGNITMVNSDSIMYMLDPDEYNIKNNYKYISFFAIEDVKQLTLKGFTYELEKTDLDIFDPLCISNSGEGDLSFSEGLLLVIHQNE